ncbi:MAG TPA: hypothetical protein DHV36_19945 [Desulfobacteraceae bacterium]|nr:hypothetical protein [Desulfobacteraceae bacterium]|tara:strand:+ start:2584 stop:2877 length:294 start_codon:yes stop_codon:yes gene_type:complete
MERFIKFKAIFEGFVFYECRRATAPSGDRNAYKNNLKKPTHVIAQFPSFRRPREQKLIPLERTGASILIFLLFGSWGGLRHLKIGIFVPVNNLGGHF